MQKSRYMIELRSAIVAGVVAVLVAAPLSNAAYDQVGHVVTIVKGERGKTGPRGPRGLRGPTGATGATGARGAPGAPYDPLGMHSVVALLPGDMQTAAAECPPGQHAVSGFHSSGDDTSGPTVIRSGVAPDGAYYFVVVRNDGDRITSIASYAVCIGS